MFNGKVLTCGIALESNRCGTVIYLIASQLSTDFGHFDAFGVLHVYVNGFLIYDTLSQVSTM